MFAFPTRLLSTYLFIEGNQVGFILNNIEELEESESVRENVLKNRYTFTVENNVERLNDFYQKYY